MTKYQPLFDLHQLVQLTHSTTGKAIFYSQVQLAKDNSVDEDEAGGWVLSAFTGKTYFEREYRREDLDDLLIATGDKDWTSFANRFKKAILEGYFHVVDMSSRECKVIVDNEVHSRSGSTSSKLETIDIEMHVVNHATRGDKTGVFLFECATYFQAHGCTLNPKAPGLFAGSNHVAKTSDENQEDNTAGVAGRVKSYDDLRLERDTLKTENVELKREIERLHANALNSAGSMSSGGLGATGGRPKSKAQMLMLANAQMFKKRKGASALNPRMKKGTVAKGTEFGSEDDDEED
ncbi:hypothetical protein KVV02_002527 [Mortierella alpina]|uniref:Uncharacterized protein n=1 Tax=Mortierella alpina TaxID=64518 RepID=A0A9P7ZXK5_MORAP|nr:hypothetical protein KVV02_002527 [Mortierella alpina]